MLSVADNERIARVGPGTPCGEMMRRYWQPALLSDELPEPDGAPVRVRLLGEDLIAFRDTDGKVGLTDAYCPHRRAPLFFGRNEECGIRCVYHGWKFNVNGECTDMPSEPAGTPLQAKVKLKAYPTAELGGIVWTYMGPPEKQPGLPNQEWLRAPPTHRFVSKTYEACNYLQALEGGMDTTHSSFLHNQRLGDTSETRNRDRTPKSEVERTDYGYWYASTRKVDDKSEYVRVNHFVMPTSHILGTFTALTGERADVPKLDGHYWAPIDDHSVHVYNWTCAYDHNTPITREYWEAWEAFCGRAPEHMLPGTFALKQNASNDYLIDRQVQKTQTYTGIEGLNTQDFALQEGMGAIVNRSEEFLGSCDRGIVMLRRILLDAIDAVERGAEPIGVHPQDYEMIRACDGLLPVGADWHDAFASELRAKW